MMHSLRYKTPFPSTNSSSVISSLREEDIFYFPTICDGLQQVSDKCYAVKLQECYDDHDVDFHMAYLLEDLKTNGVMLSSHMITGVKVVGSKSASGNSSNSSSNASSPLTPLFVAYKLPSSGHKGRHKKLFFFLLTPSI